MVGSELTAAVMVVLGEAAVLLLPAGRVILRAVVPVVMAATPQLAMVGPAVSVVTRHLTGPAASQTRASAAPVVQVHLAVQAALVVRPTPTDLSPTPMVGMVAMVARVRLSAAMAAQVVMRPLMGPQAPRMAAMVAMVAPPVVLVDQVGSAPRRGQGLLIQLALLATLRRVEQPSVKVLLTACRVLSEMAAQGSCCKELGTPSGTTVRSLVVMPVATQTLLARVSKLRLVQGFLNW